MKRAAKQFTGVAVRGGKQYVEVKDRLKYLAENFEGEYSIDTHYTYFAERKMWVVKAVLTLTQKNVTSTYSGLAQEIESEKFGQVNFTSALENAETSAVGRACAMAGIGIDLGVASADEIHKAHTRGDEKQLQRPALTGTDDPQTDYEASVVAVPAPAAEVPAVVYASAQQKEKIVRLLNHPVITRPEKTKMLLNINRLDDERATQAIAKLEKAIQDREGDRPVTA